MRKMFVIVALISLFVMEIMGVSFAAGPTLPYAGNINGNAAGRAVTDPHRTFRLVHWGDNADAQGGLTAPTCVVWETSYDSGVSVYRSSTSGDSRVAGVLITDVSSGDGALTLAYSIASDDAGKVQPWGWLQTFGPCEVTTRADKAVSAGQSVTLIGGLVSAYCSNDASMRNMGKLGFAMDDISAGSTGTIFLNVK